MSAAAWAATAAGIGVLIAAAALAVALRANRHARHSATAARDSADEAKRANDLAEQTDRRASTSNDVAWRSRLSPEQTHWVVINDGDDDAFDTHVILQFAHTRWEIEAGTIRGHGGHTSIDLQEDMQNAVAIAEERDRQIESSGIVGVAQPEISFTERIVWIDAAHSKHSREAQPRAFYWADEWIETDTND